MRLIEIRSDGTMIADGLCLKIDKALEKTISTVFWDESVKSGFVEMKKGKGRVIDSMEEFSDIINAFKEKKLNAKETDFSLRIIPEDNLVTIDGVGFEFYFEIDDNYHAVHWDGKNGIIETKDGVNIALVNVDEFSDIIEAHAAKVKEKKAEKEAQKKEFNKPENVAKREIIALEKLQTPRLLREAALGLQTTNTETKLTAKQTLQKIQDDIEALREVVKGNK